jgi:CheY-like chemotaxis protein
MIRIQDHQQGTGHVGCDPVVVVDDDGDMRELLRRMLERSGFRVVTAAHGAEALSHLRNEPASLVITDVHMPVVDGIDLMRTLKREMPNLPVIAISGASRRTAYLHLAEVLAARVVLEKPVARMELIAAVQKAMAGAG